MKRPPRYDLPNAAPGPLRLVQLFVNTSNHETGLELLPTPNALAAWFSAHGLPVENARPADLRCAHETRSALRELATTGAGAAALAAASRRAELAIAFDPPRLVAHAGGADGALGTILASVYDAVRDGRWRRFKTCRNCGWVYWDNSKNRSAAWCSMQLCGSRLKVRRYRERQRAGSR
jgi:hypothetical protein